MALVLQNLVEGNELCIASLKIPKKSKKKPNKKSTEVSYITFKKCVTNNTKGYFYGSTILNLLKIEEGLHIHGVRFRIIEQGRSRAGELTFYTDADKEVLKTNTLVFTVSLDFTARESKDENYLIGNLKTELPEGYQPRLIKLYIPPNSRASSSVARRLPSAVVASSDPSADVASSLPRRDVASSLPRRDVASSLPRRDVARRLPRRDVAMEEALVNLFFDYNDEEIHKSRPYNTNELNVVMKMTEEEKLIELVEREAALGGANGPNLTIIPILESIQQSIGKSIEGLLKDLPLESSGILDMIKQHLTGLAGDIPSKGDAQRIKRIIGGLQRGVPFLWFKIFYIYGWIQCYRNMCQIMGENIYKIIQLNKLEDLFSHPFVEPPEPTHGFDEIEGYLRTLINTISESKLADNMKANLIDAITMMRPEGGNALDTNALDTTAFFIKHAYILKIVESCQGKQDLSGHMVRYNGQIYVKSTEDDPQYFNLYDVTGDGSCLLHAVVAGLIYQRKKFEKFDSWTDSGNSTILELNKRLNMDLRYPDNNVIPRNKTLREAMNLYLFNLVILEGKGKGIDLNIPKGSLKLLGSRTLTDYIIKDSERIFRSGLTRDDKIVMYIQHFNREGEYLEEIHLLALAHMFRFNVVVYASVDENIPRRISSLHIINAEYPYIYLLNRSISTRGGYEGEHYLLLVPSTREEFDEAMRWQPLVRDTPANATTAKATTANATPAVGGSTSRVGGCIDRLCQHIDPRTDVDPARPLFPREKSGGYRKNKRSKRKSRKRKSTKRKSRKRKSTKRKSRKRR